MKLKPLTWHELPLEQRAARILYPHLAEPERVKEMTEIAKANNKKPPQPPQLAEHVPWYPQPQKGSR
jgi:hypothetical protein